MTWSRLLGSDERATVFDVVRESVWADGRLTPDELSASRGTAMALDMLGDPRVVGALARRDSTGALELSSLSLIGRRVAFAAAAWIAWIDGEPCLRERTLLAALAARLELDDEQTREIVREVARSANDVRWSGTASMSAEDWAIEVDGLLAWTVALATDGRAALRSTARRRTSPRDGERAGTGRGA